MTNKVDKCDYSKGLIYKIKCLDPEIKDIYVGSTLNEVARRRKHKKNCTSPKNDKYNLCVYQFIRVHGGWENWKLVPIKLYPCNSRLELRMEEERMIEELEEFSTLNMKRAWTDKKEYNKKWHQEHKEEIREKNKKYRETHKEENKKWRQEHKEEISEKNKVKYECPCGTILRKSDKLAHEKSKTHKHWLTTGEQKVIKGEQYTCSCGSTLTKRSKSRHEDTKKHQNYLKSLE